MNAYEEIKSLGRGAFATVRLVRRRSDNSLWVVKRFHAPLADLSVRERQEIAQEIKLLAHLHHPNIITFVDSIVEDGVMNIVMEYAAGGTLSKMIAAREGELIPEERVWEIFVQLVQALKYVHSSSVLHRDLKSENVLLTGPDARCVKVTDFGVSRILGGQTDVAATIVGTPHILSPELCQGQAYDQKSDIWALGCVLYEMCALQKPFNATNAMAIIFSIMRNRPAPIPSSCSPDMAHMVALLLQPNPALRPTAAEIEAMPVVQQHSKRWKEVLRSYEAGSAVGGAMPEPGSEAARALAAPSSDAAGLEQPGGERAGHPPGAKPTAAYDQGDPGSRSVRHGLTADEAQAARRGAFSGIAAPEDASEKPGVLVSYASPLKWAGSGGGSGGSSGGSGGSIVPLTSAIARTPSRAGHLAAGPPTSLASSAASTIALPTPGGGGVGLDSIGSSRSTRWRGTGPPSAAGVALDWGAGGGLYLGAGGILSAISTAASMPTGLGSSSGAGLSHGEQGPTHAQSEQLMPLQQRKSYLHLSEPSLVEAELRSQLAAVAEQLSSGTNDIATASSSLAVLQSKVEAFGDGASGSLWEALGRVWADAGNFNRAIHALRRALRAKGTLSSLSVLEQLGNLLVRRAQQVWGQARAGHIDDALRAAEQALQGSTTAPLVRKQLEQIAQSRAVAAGVTPVPRMEPPGLGPPWLSESPAWPPWAVVASALMYEGVGYIERMCSLGSTAERRALLGSAYKRRAWTGLGTSRREDLLSAAANYAAAHSLEMETAVSTPSPYARLNQLTCEILAGSGWPEEREVLKHGIREVEQWALARRENDPRDVWLWVQVVDAQCLLYLLGDNTASLDMVAQSYREQFAFGSTQRVKSTVIDQLNFFVEALTGMQAELDVEIATASKRLASLPVSPSGTPRSRLSGSPHPASAIKLATAALASLRSMREWEGVLLNRVVELLSRLQDHLPQASQVLTAPGMNPVQQPSSQDTAPQPRAGGAQLRQGSAFSLPAGALESVAEGPPATDASTVSRGAASSGQLTAPRPAGTTESSEATTRDGVRGAGPGRSQPSTSYGTVNNTPQTGEAGPVSDTARSSAAISSAAISSGSGYTPAAQSTPAALRHTDSGGSSALTDAATAMPSLSSRGKHAAEEGLTPSTQNGQGPAAASPMSSTAWLRPLDIEKAGDEGATSSRTPAYRVPQLLEPPPSSSGGGGTELNSPGQYSVGHSAAIAAGHHYLPSSLGSRGRGSSLVPTAVSQRGSPKFSYPRGVGGVTPGSSQSSEGGRSAASPTSAHGLASPLGPTLSPGHPGATSMWKVGGGAGAGATLTPSRGTSLSSKLSRPPTTPRGFPLAAQLSPMGAGAGYRISPHAPQASAAGVPGSAVIVTGTGRSRATSGDVGGAEPRVAVPVTPHGGPTDGAAAAREQMEYYSLRSPRCKAAFGGAESAGRAETPTPTSTLAAGRVSLASGASIAPAGAPSVDAPAAVQAQQPAAVAAATAPAGETSAAATREAQAPVLQMHDGDGATTAERRPERGESMLTGQAPAPGVPPGAAQPPRPELAALPSLTAAAALSGLLSTMQAQIEPNEALAAAAARAARKKRRAHREMLMLTANSEDASLLRSSASAQGGPVLRRESIGSGRFPAAAWSPRPQPQQPQQHHQHYQPLMFQRPDSAMSGLGAITAGNTSEGTGLLGSATTETRPREGVLPAARALGAHVPGTLQALPVPLQHRRHHHHAHHRNGAHRRYEQEAAARGSDTPDRQPGPVIQQQSSFSSLPAGDVPCLNVKEAETGRSERQHGGEALPAAQQQQLLLQQQQVLPQHPHQHPLHLLQLRHGVASFSPTQSGLGVSDSFSPPWLAASTGPGAGNAVQDPRGRWANSSDSLPARAPASALPGPPAALQKSAVNVSPRAAGAFTHEPVQRSSAAQVGRIRVPSKLGSTVFETSHPSAGSGGSPAISASSSRGATGLGDLARGGQPQAGLHQRDAGSLGSQAGSLSVPSSAKATPPFGDSSTPAGTGTGTTTSSAAAPAAAGENPFGRSSMQQFAIPQRTSPSPADTQQPPASGRAARAAAETVAGPAVGSHDGGATVPGGDHPREGATAGTKPTMLRPTRSLQLSGVADTPPAHAGDAVNGADSNAALPSGWPEEAANIVRGHRDRPTDSGSSKKLTPLGAFRLPRQTPQSGLASTTTLAHGFELSPAQGSHASRSELQGPLSKQSTGASASGFTPSSAAARPMQAPEVQHAAAPLAPVPGPTEAVKSVTSVRGTDWTRSRGVPGTSGIRNELLNMYSIGTPPHRGMGVPAADTLSSASSSRRFSSKSTPTNFEEGSNTTTSSPQASNATSAASPAAGTGAHDSLTPHFPEMFVVPVEAAVDLAKRLVETSLSAIQPIVGSTVKRIVDTATVALASAAEAVVPHRGGSHESAAVLPHRVAAAAAGSHSAGQPTRVEGSTAPAGGEVQKEPQGASRQEGALSVAEPAKSQLPSALVPRTAATPAAAAPAAQGLHDSGSTARPTASVGGARTGSGGHGAAKAASPRSVRSDSGGSGRESVCSNLGFYSAHEEPESPVLRQRLQPTGAGAPAAEPTAATASAAAAAGDSERAGEGLSSAASRAGRTTAPAGGGTSSLAAGLAHLPAPALEAQRDGTAQQPPSGVPAPPASVVAPLLVLPPPGQVGISSTTGTEQALPPSGPDGESKAAELGQKAAESPSQAARAQILLRLLSLPYNPFARSTPRHAQFVTLREQQRRPPAAAVEQQQVDSAEQQLPPVVDLGGGMGMLATLGRPLLGLDSRDEPQPPAYLPPLDPAPSIRRDITSLGPGSPQQAELDIASGTSETESPARGIDITATGFTDLSLGGMSRPPIRAPVGDSRLVAGRVRAAATPVPASSHEPGPTPQAAPSQPAPQLQSTEAVLVGLLPAGDVAVGPGTGTAPQYLDRDARAEHTPSGNVLPLPARATTPSPEGGAPTPVSPPVMPAPEMAGPPPAAIAPAPAASPGGPAAIAPAPAASPDHGIIPLVDGGAFGCLGCNRRRQSSVARR